MRQLSTAVSCAGPTWWPRWQARKPPPVLSMSHAGAMPGAAATPATVARTAGAAQVADRFLNPREESYTKLQVRRHAVCLRQHTPQRNLQASLLLCLAHPACLPAAACRPTPSCWPAARSWPRSLKRHPGCCQSARRRYRMLALPIFSLWWRCARARWRVTRPARPSPSPTATSMIPLTPRPFRITVRAAVWPTCRSLALASRGVPGDGPRAVAPRPAPAAAAAGAACCPAHRPPSLALLRSLRPGQVCVCRQLHRCLLVGQRRGGVPGPQPALRRHQVCGESRGRAASGPSLITLSYPHSPAGSPPPASPRLGATCSLVRLTAAPPLPTRQAAAGSAQAAG